MEKQDSLSINKDPKLGGYLLTLAMPAVLLAIVALPFRHQFTLAEPDLLRMMSALVYGHVSGDKTMVDFQPYGIAFSFGWYQLLYAIAPEGWLDNPDLVTLLINRFGIVSGLLCSLLCPLYFSVIFGRKTAVVSAILFFLSSMMLPVAFSGHPILGASACLFAAGCLLTLAEDKPVSESWFYLVAAFILLVLGLTLRAEIILGFPFLWLASKNRLTGKASWLFKYGLRGSVMAIAFGCFLILQHQYLDNSGGGSGALSEFIKQFLSISKISKGAVIFLLSLGGATIVAGCFAIFKGARLQKNEIFLLLILALPSLALFIANPMPARHFFFPVLAVCLAVSLLLARWQPSAKWLLGASLAIVIGNQVVIELIRPAIISRSNYALNYPSLTERRFTPAAPSGAFVLDQPAMIVNEDGERSEAIRLAAQLPQRLVVLADHSFPLVAHMLAKDTSLRAQYQETNGVKYLKLTSPEREIVVVQKFPTWPKDLTADVLNESAWQGWPVYVQPSTLSPYDKTKIPSGREFKPV